MKGYLVLLILTLLGFVDANAQEYKKIDDCTAMFIYSYQFYEIHKDSESLKRQDMILEVGKRTSKFCSTKNHNTDSLIMLYANEPAELAFSKISSQATNQSSHKYASSYVFKGYPEAKTTLFYAYDNGASNFYKVEEELDFDWKIDNYSNEKIIGYSCTKATCSFAGRDYEAWFTTEIPISDGPYKFRGLPGLIVKISDSDKEHIFELQEVRNVKRKNIYLLEKESIKTDAKGYVKALEASKSKFIEELKTLISNDAARTRAITRVQKRNNFIERY